MKRVLTPKATWHAFLYGGESWTYDDICNDPDGWKQLNDKLYRTYWFVSRGYVHKRRYKNRK